jgi:hypothetical protein
MVGKSLCLREDRPLVRRAPLRPILTINVKHNLRCTEVSVRLRFVGAGALVMLSEAKHLGLEREIRTGYARGVLRGGQILR